MANKLYISIIISLSLFQLNSYSQFPDKIKSITRVEDSIVRSIKLFDQNGNLIFSKNNEEFGPVIMLSATIFSEKNVAQRMIYGHSNVGFSIYEPVFDQNGNEIKTYSYPDLPEVDTGFNFNPYKHILDYSSPEQLISDPVVQKILSSEKYLQTQRLFDLRGNEILNVYFEENGDTSTIMTYEFDDLGNEIHFVYKGSFLGSWQYYYSYDSNGNRISSKRVNSEGDTTEVHLYSYDMEQNKVEDKYFRKGEFQYGTKFIYNQQQLVRIEHYREDESLWRVQEFEYDDQGNKAKEISQRLDNGKKNVYTWHYVYYE